MSRLDIVIFGATGFTGRKAVEEAVRISKKTPISWGVAGRSEQKLEQLLAEVGAKTGGDDLSKVKMIIADVKDGQSLKDMTSQAKVIANCCGPYRLYGEPVIKACIATKTHHVDVSGEPQFIESQQLAHGAAAAAAGVYVVSACGFDSIPNDMGVVFLQQNFPGTLNSVESYLWTHMPDQYYKEMMSGGCIHYGTWESLVYSLAHSGELSALRKQLFPTKLPAFKPRLEARPRVHKHESKWCLPFPGADNSIVYRTQRYFYETKQQRPVQFKAYISMNSLATTILLILNAVFVSAMTSWGWSRKLLLNYPRLFSMGMVTHDGPTEGVMDNTFFTFTLRGEGWSEGADMENTKPDKHMVVQVKGVNPGYGATVTALMYSALTVLKEQDKMPGTGGVLTTGAAFKDTNLIKHLNENNLTFEIVCDSNK
ncbi:unnamed protein product [Plutella xylostella]|uniref:(diamondback moth) hypothetical protein n=1 Tax=Plutella xylostella TaxID=51655 RepID=A0A8S4F4S5_PLUXY|nr:unnamed protein product [Plutella xylostella]